MWRIDEEDVYGYLTVGHGRSYCDIGAIGVDGDIQNNYILIPSQGWKYPIFFIEKCGNGYMKKKIHFIPNIY